MADYDGGEPKVSVASTFPAVSTTPGGIHYPSPRRRVSGSGIKATPIAIQECFVAYGDTVAACGKVPTQAHQTDERDDVTCCKCLQVMLKKTDKKQEDHIAEWDAKVAREIAEAFVKGEKVGKALGWNVGHVTGAQDQARWHKAKETGMPYTGGTENPYKDGKES